MARCALGLGLLTASCIGQADFYSNDGGLTGSTGGSSPTGSTGTTTTSTTTTSTTTGSGGSGTTTTTSGSGGTGTTTTSTGSGGTGTTTTSTGSGGTGTTTTGTGGSGGTGTTTTGSGGSGGTGTTTTGTGGGAVCGSTATWSHGFVPVKTSAVDEGSESHAVAADSCGNTAITGSFHDRIDFGGGPLDTPFGGRSTIAVATFDSAGSPRWSKRFGGGPSGLTRGRAVAYDATGNLFVCGSFSGDADFGGGLLVSVGLSDAFVVKLDPAGNHLWSKGIGGTMIDEARGLAVDAAGNVVVTGAFGSSEPLGGGSAPALFAMKLSPAGAMLWQKGFGDPGQSQAVALDAMGNVFLAGDFAGTVSFGGGSLVSAGSSVNGDVYVAKLDGNGNHVWSRRFGDSSAQAARAVAVGSAGEVFLTGNFAGTLDFGGGGLVAFGAQGGFVAKLAANGNHVWSRSFGTNAASNGIAITAGGGPVIVGRFQGIANFGAGAVAASGVSDAFVVKYDAFGSALDVKHYGMSSTAANAIALDPSGKKLVTGIYLGAPDFGNGPLPNEAHGSGATFLAALGP